MDAPERSATDWTELTGVDDVRVGDLAAPGRVTVSVETLARLRTAMGAVVGDVVGDPAGDVDVPLGIADICPDPLVFAVEAGLPRPMSLGSAIDGGSTWRDLAPIEGDELFAVSAITEVAERITADGRQLVRIVYETRFSSQQGVLVGIAAGTSLHIGSAR